MPILLLLTAIRLTGAVTDLAGVMRAEDAEAVRVASAGLQQADSTQVRLLTVRTTGGVPIEEFSIDTARANGLGQKRLDNGVLVVVAVDDRRARIEVGYGLEGALNDGKAGAIIRERMAPRFRAGDYSGGARAGVEAVIAAVRGEVQAPAKRPGVSIDSLIIFLVIAGGVVLVLVLVLALRASERREQESKPRRSGPFSDFTLFSDGPGGGDFGGSDSGDSGGGDSGGGGGDFGGGGASGDW